MCVRFYYPVIDVIHEDEIFDRDRFADRTLMNIGEYGDEQNI